MDADALVVGHADEQGQPTLEPRAQRHHHGVTAFGDGGLALGLAAAVVEVDPVQVQGYHKNRSTGEHSALTAADEDISVVALCLLSSIPGSFFPKKPGQAPGPCLLLHQRFHLRYLVTET